MKITLSKFYNINNYFIMFIVFIMVLLYCDYIEAINNTLSVHNNTSIIIVKDMALDAEIRENLGLTKDEDITQDIALTLTYLDACSKGIKNLDGLHYFTNLQTLYLCNNKITNIDFLKGLVHLKDISLYDNQINDITALVFNPGIGYGDSIDLINNPLFLNEESKIKNNYYIEILNARGVYLECTL